MTEERKGAVVNLRKPDDRRIGIDGVVYSEAADKKINSLVHATFNTPAGQQVLDYLEGLTLRTINGPEASDAALRHQEGMRHVVSIVLERYRKGKEG